VFGLVFVGGKLASRNVGRRVRSSVVGPVDRLLGAGFGALKGLIGATLLYLLVSLVYDTIWGRAAERPEWIAQARTYPLLQSSGDTIVDLVEARRGPDPSETNSTANAQ
jgi:membrane protein required for colicin V production